MKRIITAIVVAIEAAGVLAAGLGVTLIPLVLLWMIEYQLGFPFATVIGLSASAWLLGNRVPLNISIDADTMQTLGAGTDSLNFVVSLAPLGITLITVLAGIALGKRASASSTPAVGLIVGVLVYLGGAWLIGSQLVTGFVAVKPADYLLYPAMLYGLSAIGGFVYASARNHTPRFERTLERLESWRAWTTGPATRTFLTGLRLGAVVAIGVYGAAAVILALTLIVGYADVVSLSQSLHVDVMGAITLTIAQAALLPNLIAWTVSWLLGPGFTLGIGSTISPVATDVGPVPALPIFGVLPEGAHTWGLLGTLIPILLAFILSYRIYGTIRRNWGQTVPLGALLLSALGAAGASAVILGGVAWLSSGAIGPARLQEVGPSGLSVGLWAALFVGVSSLIGFAVAGAGQKSLALGIDLDRASTSLTGLRTLVVGQRDNEPAEGRLDQQLIDPETGSELADEVTENLSDLRQLDGAEAVAPPQARPKRTTSLAATLRDKLKTKETRMPTIVGAESDPLKTTGADLYDHAEESQSADVEQTRADSRDDDMTVRGSGRSDSNGTEDYTNVRAVAQDDSDATDDYSSVRNAEDDAPAASEDNDSDKEITLDGALDEYRWPERE